MINSMGYMLTQYIVCHDKHKHNIYGMGYMLTQYIVCHDKQYGLHAYTIYSLS